MTTRNLAAWGRDPNDGILKWDYVQPTSLTQYNLPSGNYTVDSGLPLQKMYPMSDSVTHQYSHHRCAHPAMKWECPVRAMGGSNPRFYEIVQAPVGMTIGEFLENDVNGDLVINREYGLLTWTTPVVGNHRVVVRCTDQYGRYVVFAFTLTCATGLHLFVAPSARGTGNGSSYANAMGESSAILNGSTSPSINKVLVLCGGDYTSTNALTLNKDTVASSVIGYPSETAIWRNKIAYDNHDCAVGFLTVKEVGTSDFGVVRSYSASNRLASFYNIFDKCFNSSIGSSNNQSVHGFSSGVTWRENIVNLNNTYIDCDELHALDAYNMDSLLVQCETWTTSNNPALLNQGRSVWFPKARHRNCEISFNVYDNPHVSGRSQGIIQAYNGIDGSQGVLQDTVSSIEYNFIRCASTESALFSNNAANLASPLGSSVELVNSIHRNTFIDGSVASKNWDYQYNVNRRTLLDNNIKHSPSGLDASVTSIDGVADSVWFLNPSMLFGTSIVDAGGRLTVGNVTHRGKKGAQVYGVSV